MIVTESHPATFFLPAPPILEGGGNVKVVKEWNKKILGKRTKDVTNNSIILLDKNQSTPSPILEYFLRITVSIFFMKQF